MSGNYYKKVKSAPPPNSYGFKQVNARELQDIIKRVTRSTYSAKLYTEEQRQVNNYEHLLAENGRRNVASACGRRTVPSRTSSATTTNTASSDGMRRRMTERELNRIIRRLQRPTTATSLHHAVDPNTILHDNQHKNFYSKIGNQQPLPDHVAKTIDKLRRPTTATLAKTLNNCHLCYDHENKKTEELDAFDYIYCEDKVVPAEEVDYIVGRVSVPTHASNNGQHACAKTPVYIDEVKIRENLPLLSGLKRSRNVREITERLCPSRKHHGFTPQATTITTY